jgi:hypothetical protein
METKKLRRFQTQRWQRGKSYLCQKSIFDREVHSLVSSRINPWNMKADGHISGPDVPSRSYTALHERCKTDLWEGILDEVWSWQATNAYNWGLRIHRNLHLRLSLNSPYQLFSLSINSTVVTIWTTSFSTLYLSCCSKNKHPLCTSSGSSLYRIYVALLLLEAEFLT